MLRAPGRNWRRHRHSSCISYPALSFSSSISENTMCEVLYYVIYSSSESERFYQSQREIELSKPEMYNKHQALIKNECRNRDIDRYIIDNICRYMSTVTLEPSSNMVRNWRLVCWIYKSTRLKVFMDSTSEMLMLQTRRTASAVWLGDVISMLVRVEIYLWVK